MISLAFTCAHVGPDQDLSRFTVLGDFIADTQPENIIQLGDFVTVDSLSQWDQNKRALLNGRNYNKDILSGRAALQKLIKPIVNLQKKQKYQKKRVYRPKFVWCLGNHEDRVEQYVIRNPECEGKFDIVTDLGIHYFLQTTEAIIVPYRHQHILNGVAFTHAIINAAGKPVGGKTVMARSLDVLNRSTIFGHTHRLVYDSVGRYGGQVQALTVGTFSEHTDEYAADGKRLTNYYRGIVLIHHLDDGLFDFEPITIRRLRDGSKTS